MIQSFTLYQLYPQIHWPSFFKDWDFDPEFANIASVQGCDVVRASWLTDFEEQERSSASEAMQLLKEANRMVDLLNRDYKTQGNSIRIGYQLKDNQLFIDGLHSPLNITPENFSFGSHPTFDFMQLKQELEQESELTLFATTIDSEVDLLFEQDEYKRKLVQTLAHRFTESATLSLYSSQFKEKLHTPLVAFMKREKELLHLIEEKLSLTELDIQIKSENLLTPNASKVGLMVPHYILFT